MTRRRSARGSQLLLSRRARRDRPMAESRKNSTVVELGGPDRVAADWIARLDADESAELRRQFQEWQDRSPHNREAAERLERLWSELDGLSGSGAGATPDAEHRRMRRWAAPPRRVRTCSGHHGT